MNHSQKKTTLSVMLLLFLPSCFTLKTATVDRKTQLENQILGSFRRLEKELVLASSVRGSQTTAVSDIYRDAVRAHLNRAYNKDDIDQLKQLKQVGESNTGFLVIRQPPEDPKQAEDLKKLLEIENRDRETILAHLIAVNEDLSAKDRPMVQRMLWRLNLATAKNGDTVQRVDGSWQIVLGTEKANENAVKAEK